MPQIEDLPLLLPLPWEVTGLPKSLFLGDLLRSQEAYEDITHKALLCAHFWNSERASFTRQNSDFQKGGPRTETSASELVVEKVSSPAVANLCASQKKYI